ncbi:MarR family winged helix-turn-helix transcriptional regulator [Catenuloplanes indicus]|uniref:DNA-binding MarR family transcriptional regulator n=1 Tax=Catenuloplanes indicus TaxID=137267 RepID=A0AAE4B211_9ACTN|nr:MarR family winged helix-turn-helix transcriptional regulator [Catenuloplanes indicus]MDQ0371192.1 DNA-binding MarR family transcriptional regulator [Catenuloplanes indicus]
MDRADALRRLEGELGVLSRRLKCVHDAQARVVHPGLQPNAYLVLIWIGEHGPARPSAIVEEFALDKGAVSRLLTHLDDLGLITRVPDPSDRRATLISATGEAVTRMATATESVRRHRGDRLSDWPDDQLSAFVTALAHYNRTLGQPT